MKRLVSVFLVFSMVFTLATSTMNLAVSAADDGTGDDWLHTVGNKIVDKNGNSVWLTGANWFGFNTGTNVFDGVWSANMSQAISGMADRGINLLRIPISSQLILQWSKGVYPPANVNDFVNPELDGMNSLQLFDTAIKNCKEVGMKVMVDIHSPKSEAMGHIYPVWYDPEITTEVWISTLEWITERYKNDDTIVALDLENEPHGKPGDKNMAKWDDSKDLNNWKNAAEVCAKRILAINPNILIVVEGVEVYPKPGYDYTAVDDWGKESKYFFNWWGGNLRGVKDHPINLGSHQKQLVYSPHDYGPLVHRQPWFYIGFDLESLYKDCWKDNWAFINEENIAPLLMGEWGGFMDGGDNEKWMKLLRDYMIENRIHHTFWCYNANSGDTGGLVGHDFITWDEEKYSLLKPALWQNESGKFIGLDHKVPLGKNGITVTEYYDGKPPVSNPPVTIPVTPPISLTPTNSGDKGLVGDVNGDDKVNAGDYTLMRKYVLKLTDDFPVEDDLWAGDLDGSGSINAGDYTLLRRYILGTITEFKKQ